MSDLVPFGKYKGQPIEDMLADDGYMAWLEAQPWFRERFAHLLKRRDADAMSRTPVHNRLQALFLGDEYCAAFLHVGAQQRVAEYCRYAERRKTGAINELLDAASRLKRWNEDAQHAERLAAELYSAPVLYRRVPTFERDGADVCITAWAKIPSWSDEKYNGYPSPAAKASALEEELGTLRIEIKPTIADEYPAVLRQMARHRTEFLFVGAYQGEGVTEAQFVQIFAASGKRVVFKRDVDADVARGGAA
jgi:hypothetical protein